MGPWTTTPEHFAGGRLGFAIFAAMTWTLSYRPHTIILCTRILEKTSAFALVCLNHAIKTAMKRYDDGYMKKYVQWSDGPKQFKNGQMLAAPTAWMTEYELDDICINFGGPSHWKGPWDRLFGTVSRALNLRALAGRLETVQQVVAALQLHFEEVMRKHPRGMQYTVEEFLPTNKSDYHMPWLTAGSMFGTENSYAWRFTRNDQRSHGKKKLTGVNPFIHTGITLRNLGMTMVEGSLAQTGFPAEDVTKKEPEPEEDPPIDASAADCSMTVINGWKSSYIDVQKQSAEKKRKKLFSIHEAMPPAVHKLAEAPRHHSVVGQKESAKRRRENDKKGAKDDTKFKPSDYMTMCAASSVRNETHPPKPKRGGAASSGS